MLIDGLLYLYFIFGRNLFKFCDDGLFGMIVRGESSYALNLVGDGDGLFGMMFLLLCCCVL